MNLDRIEQLLVAFVLLLSIVLLTLRIQPDSYLERFDLPAQDFVQRNLLEDLPTPQNVVMVLVDDESLLRLQQQWPLDRKIWGTFLRKLNSYKPSAVALDMWFETPGATARRDLAIEISDKLSTGPLANDITIRFLLMKLNREIVDSDGDRAFTETLAELGNVILGVACSGGATDTLTKELAFPPPSLKNTGKNAAAMHCKTLSGNLPQLAMAARSQGMLEVLFDHDGLIRRYPYQLGYQKTLLPALATELVRVGRPKQAKEVETSISEFISSPPLLRYHLKDSFQTVRLSDVIEAPLESPTLKEAFKDKLVIVSVSAIGTEDYRSTPLENDIPGGYIHANAVENLLSGRWIRTQGQVVDLSAIGAFSLLLLIAVFGRRAHKLRFVFGPAAGGALLWGGVFASALGRGWLIPLTPVWLCILLWAIVKLFIQLAHGKNDRQRAQQIHHAFQFYLAPAVVEALVKNPDLLKLGGERREITAFFSDVANFTTISELLDPHDLSTLLNECLGAQTEIILEEGGIVDKYIGDAVVAMFGAPMEQPDHAVRACRAAIRIEKKLALLREEWLQRGFPDVTCRIGLNTGPAVVGNMGSTQRFDYTMLGDTVNLAARLESANKAYGSLILCGQETAAQVKHKVLLRELDRVQVKGKTTGITIFNPLAMIEEATEELQQQADDFAVALALYRGQKWEEARRSFQALANAGDESAKILGARIDQLETETLGDDWDGVFTMQTK